MPTMPRPSPHAGSRLRLWVERLVLLLTAVVVMRTWYVEGLLVPCPVASGSMAETLLGVHREVTCKDCGLRFVCDADLKPVSPRAICPNCGYAGNDLESRPDLAGDRVLVVKPVYHFRRPRRWEVIACRDPGQAARTLVKRVAGLPGESIQIRQGDVYADGQIQRKTLPQQRAVAILVHDTNHQPGIDPVHPPRWQGTKNGLWIAGGGRFAHPQVPAKDAVDDWLEYRHWQRGPGQGGDSSFRSGEWVAGVERSEPPAPPVSGGSLTLDPGHPRPDRLNLAPWSEVREGPVTDLCGYNQTQPRRQEDVHPVADLLLSLRLVKTSGQGRLVLRASDGAEEFQARIDPQRRRYEVLRGGQPVAGTGGELPPLGEGITLEVSLFDQQFLLAFDGRAAVALPYQRSQPRLQPTSSPLAVGSQGGLGVEICDLRVYRDVYYTHPIGLQGRWGLDEPVHLVDDEFFLLGDNSPISEDSRTWPGGPAVDAKFLVGKPLVVHFPARLVGVGPWRFQVPDVARIRYIR
jgi:signal peptidase I